MSTLQACATVIHEACDTNTLERCYAVAQELRPHLSATQFIEQVLRQQAAGYHLMYLQADDGVISILGYRLTEQLAWGKAVYIDDLATLSSARGLGYGSILLKWAIEKARAEHCQQVHLDTGTQRHTAHRLYLNHGFELRSYHMIKDL